MNTTPRRDARSLIERAAEVYDFGAVLKERAAAVAPAKGHPEKYDFSGTPKAAAAAFLSDPFEAHPVLAPAAPASAGATLVSAPYVHRGFDGVIDKTRLRDEGFILPDAPVGTLAEEFRLVKRQLLLRSGRDEQMVTPKDRMVLVCSAQPNEGKTFCAVNLALSLASERDNEVLLVDADVAKPEVLSTLGLAGQQGLIDAIADPHGDVERFVIRTDIPKLSVLPAGRATNDDTEWLSSARAAQVIAGLATANPRRIVILDSAPALAASPAAVLAHRVGRILMVVRADRTTETELREALALLDGCPDIALLLNGTSFFGTNRTYGSYYGADQ